VEEWERRVEDRFLAEAGMRLVDVGVMDGEVLVEMLLGLSRNLAVDTAGGLHRLHHYRYICSLAVNWIA
jgi:hypothetical protein